MKKRGFTIIEILFVLAFLGVISVLYYKNNNKEIDLRRSRALSDQANVHAKLFINYLVSNESSISTATSSTAPTIISMDQLIASGSIQTATGVNLLGQKPCLAIIKNSNTNKIEAVMYYVSEKSNPNITNEFMQTTAISLNELAGVYDGANVKTSSWSLPSSSIYFLNSGQCVAGYTLRANSLVLNLNLYPEFNHAIHQDIGLYRKVDPNQRNNPLGTAGNKNTSLTDIITNGKDIQLNNSANLKLTTNNSSSLSLNNANLMANTFEASTVIASGTQCSSSDLGTIARQGDANVGNTQSDVVCSYSPLICGGAGYCYTPVLNNTIIYKDVSNSGWMGSTFTCPANVPYLQAATAYQPGHSNPYVTYQTTSFNNYTMTRGAIANGDSAADCATWQITYRTISQLFWAGCVWNGERGYKSTSCSAGGGYSFNTSNPNCGKQYSGNCDGGSSGNPDNAIVSWTCTNRAPPTQAYINSATCTSKLIIKAN